MTPFKPLFGTLLFCHRLAEMAVIIYKPLSELNLGSGYSIEMFSRTVHVK